MPPLLLLVAFAAAAPHPPLFLGRDGGAAAGTPLNRGARTPQDARAPSVWVPLAPHARRARSVGQGPGVPTPGTLRGWGPAPRHRLCLTGSKLARSPLALPLCTGSLHRQQSGPCFECLTRPAAAGLGPSCAPLQGSFEGRPARGPAWAYRGPLGVLKHRKGTGRAADRRARGPNTGAGRRGRRMVDRSRGHAAAEGGTAAPGAKLWRTRRSVPLYYTD